VEVGVVEGGNGGTGTMGLGIERPAKPPLIGIPVRPAKENV
jgi:hypothetical protein